MQKPGLANNCRFDHQGWESTDIGRFWQIYLFIGPMLWLFLVGRALWPAMRNRANESRHIAGLLFLSTVAIGLLYAAGLMWREDTHISIVTYWRFWIGLRSEEHTAAIQSLMRNSYDFFCLHK